MSMDVLQNRSQIANARQELASKGVSFIEAPWRSIFRRFGIGRGVAVGDEVKSWDVLSTLKFLEKNVEKDESILDIGCYASEVIVALHKLGLSGGERLDGFFQLLARGLQVRGHLVEHVGQFTAFVSRIDFDAP